MAAKRKRHRAKADVDEANKRSTISHCSNAPVNVVRQSLLSQFYPEVSTLREYLLSKLPDSSRIRRKKVVGAGRRNLKQEHGNIEKTIDEADDRLGLFLDSTLVGVPPHNPQSGHRATRWRSFTSRVDASELELTGTPLGLGHMQSEVRRIE